MTRDAGGEGRLPGHQLPMASPQNVAHNHQVEILTVDAGPPESGGHDRTSQGGRGQVPKSAAKPTDSRSLGRHDKDVGHKREATRPSVARTPP